MERRDFLKSCGLVLGAGAAMGSPLSAAAQAAERMILPAGDGDVDNSYNDIPVRGLRPDVARQVSIIVIGAGNRGRTYSGFAKKFPEALKITGVSDILPDRAKWLADRNEVAPDMRFGHYNEVFASGKKLADAVAICTPDDRHFEPCMKALELGYDVLLEKPVAQTEKECKAILAQAKKYKRIVAVCHVLRYSPYFLAMREVIRSGVLGDIACIQHFEPVQYAHMAHSYVRGNWRRSDETTPIILAKSCHDLDILRWLLDKPCESIVADGNLFFFKKENAPEGAPAKCTDGCPHEANCPYSAITIYTKLKQHLGVFDLHGDKNPDHIMERLLDPRYSSYARCVFHCDNNQPDHYVANMLFEGGTSASFTMSAFSPKGGRRTRILGTLGYLEGDMSKFTVWDYLTRTPKVWNRKVSDIPEYKGSGHGGGDLALVRDFVEAVSWQDINRLSSAIDVSIESHIMGFAAERSRQSGKKQKLGGGSRKK